MFYVDILGIVSNAGQYPNAEGECQTYMTSGPMVRYAADLLPMFKIVSSPQKDKLKLDQPVSCFGTGIINEPAAWHKPQI